MTVQSNTSNTMQPLWRLDTPNVLDDREMLTRSHAIVVKRSVPVEQAIDRIRQLGLGDVKAEDVFVFEMAAASDGVDSYWTQQDVKTSLTPMADDLRRGQSLLGNHEYGTFAYGSSFDAGIEKAKVDAPYYEDTFYRGITDERMKTSKLLVGQFFIDRNVRRNGEDTESIIAGLQSGSIRKASISFLVGQYVCGLDGLEMTSMSWLGMAAAGVARATRHEEAPEVPVCEHFPGVKDRQTGEIAWAVMKGNQLLETSLVYKNSSPSALLMARAVEMARAGMLTAAQAGQIEERYGTRLPRFDRTVWAGAPKEDRMDPVTRDPEVEPVEDQLEPEEEPEVEPAPTEEPATDDRSTEDASAADVDAPEPAIEEEPAPAEPTAEMAQAAARIRAFETRETALTEALGEPPTAEAIRSLRERAAMGDLLYADLVNEAVAARVGVGVQFSEEEYRKILTGSRSIEFVRSERSSWQELKQARFRAGRTAPAKDPAGLTPRAGRRKSEAAPVTEAAEADTDDGNILAPRAKK